MCIRDSIPTDEKELNAEQRATIEKMVERLEDDEDVQNVYTCLLYTSRCV